jgi:carboxylate-amine ligase
MLASLKARIDMDACYRFGIEEEYFLADAATRGTPRVTKRCMVRLVDRSPTLNRGQTGGARAITAENLWRAQRDGVRAAFLDMDGDTVAFAAGLDAVLSQVAEDAAALDCEADLARLRIVATQGTSADRQLAVFAAASGDARQALSTTVDWIAAATDGTAP